MTRRQVGPGLLIMSILVMTSRLVWAEGKQPWELTLDERLEKRFDPKINTSPRQGAMGGVDLEHNVVSVEGRRQPELLMPYELYQGLLRRVYGPDEEMNAMYREQFTPVLQSLGMDEKTFWIDLERLSADLLHVDRKVRALTKGLETFPEARKQEVLEEVERLQANYCQDRARLLGEAESLFGREKLYRFFYEGVARTVNLTSHGATPEQMKFVAGGCQ